MIDFFVVVAVKLWTFLLLFMRLYFVAEGLFVFWFYLIPVAKLSNLQQRCFFLNILNAHIGQMILIA